MGHRILISKKILPLWTSGRLLIDLRSREKFQLFKGIFSDRRFQRAEALDQFSLLRRQRIGEGTFFPSRQIIERALKEISIGKQAVQLWHVVFFMRRNRRLPDAKRVGKLLLRQTIFYPQFFQPFIYCHAIHIIILALLCLKCLTY